MSNLTESLRGDKDSAMKTLLLEQLSHAQEKRRGADALESAYWQGRKDAFRIVLAFYLNYPGLLDDIDRVYFE